MKWNGSNALKICLYNLFLWINCILGFDVKHLKTWDEFVALMFTPVDPSSLAFSRILFGLLMILDIPEERGLSQADIRWKMDLCKFPLFDSLQPLPLEWICIIYFIMLLGAFGIMLGAYFKIACLTFTFSYWYLFILDKSLWNNHSYLYGQIAILFTLSDANNFWSVDILLGRKKGNVDVPIWNYAILRFQLFILYFYAGLKKSDSDWLNGYSATNLSSHWIFSCLRLFLTPHQINFWIVHIFVFVFDLTIGFWICFEKTRPIGFLFLASFHFMNSQMFEIGMFPYVCLATMPLFCNFDWPKFLMAKLKTPNNEKAFSTLKNDSCFYSNKNEGEVDCKVLSNAKKHTVAVFMIFHITVQLFLPFSHFITKGYNNWTNGLYGYSWDMMIHSWDTARINVKIVNKDTGEEMFLDPKAWVFNDKWHKHGDMVVQYSKCIKTKIVKFNPKLKNISLHLDILTSLNGRFQQRMFDPRVDLLQVKWSPFKPIPWLMPLLVELSEWRSQITNIIKNVHSWSNYSNVLFVADFPGLYMDHYIQKDLTNISFTVLKGNIILETRNLANVSMGPGDVATVYPEKLYKVHSVSKNPSCYMYTFYNMSRSLNNNLNSTRPSLHYFIQNSQDRLDNILRSVVLIKNAIVKIFLSISMLTENIISLSN